MNHAELVMRRRNVLAFIQADPIELVISRNPNPTKTAAGGYTRSTTPVTPLAKQLARIVPNKRRYNNGIVNAEAGDIPHTDYLLLGQHTLNAEVNDTFFWKGEQYTITGIHKQRTESFLASIELAGSVNRHEE